MAQPLQISWNNFSGGLADQKYQAPQGRFFKGYGFDTSGYGAKPVSSPDLIRTYPDGIRAIFNTERLNGNKNNIVWLSNGTVYFNDLLRYTIAGNGKQGYNIGYMKPIGGDFTKLYYFHFTSPTNAIKYIHRSDVNGQDFQENYRQYTSTDGNPFVSVPDNPSPMIVRSEGDRILFTYYNELWQINASEVVSKILSFPSEQNIVGLTEFQGQYKIYTVAGNSTSRIYVWGGTDTDDAPQLNVDLQGLAITGGVQGQGAYDYMVADGSLYQVAGVQYQELYNKLNGRIVLSYDDRIIYEILQNQKIMLAEYFNNPGYSKGIHPINIIDINAQGNGITAIDYNSEGLVFNQSNKLYRRTISSGIPESGNVTCFLESMVFTGDNIQFEKSITEIILKFSGFTTNLLKLYAQVNENENWIKIWEGNNNSISTQNHGLKIPKHQFLTPIGDFNTIRFKIEAPHTGQAQGIVYGVDLFGNQNVGK